MKVKCIVRLFLFVSYLVYFTSDATERMIDEHQMFHKCEVKSDQKSN